MGIKQYYKVHIYDYGYNKGYSDCGKYNQAVEKGKSFQHHILSDDIYFNDEMDYYLISDWLSCYEPEEEDIKFIEALGYTLDDFAQEQEDE